MNGSRKRIAVYGGTFDPVHFGHLAVAKNVVELFEIDQLFLVPARQAPHKVEREVTQPIHRYAMLAMATADDDRLLVSTVELHSPSRGYTVETLRALRKLFGESAELFFVMGTDSWAEITMWREWQTLLQLASQIVVTRPGYEVKDSQSGTAADVVDVRGWNTSQISKALDEVSGSRVYISDAASVDVSATDIRAAARNGRWEELRTMVPPEVANYILKYELYKNSNEN